MMLHKYANITKGFASSLAHREQKVEESESINMADIPPNTNKELIKLLDFMKTTDFNYLFVVSPYVRTKEHKEIYNTVSDSVNEYGYDFRF